MHSIGPANARIVVVGEAPGRQEELTGIPLIGASGQEFDTMLDEAGLSRSECYLTNVLWTRPPDNKLEAFCVTAPQLKALGGYPERYAGYGPLGTGKYLHPEFLVEVDRLRDELIAVRPNLILAIGATPLWALTGSGGISKVRGTIQATEWGKLLPTYHPAYILRDWSARPIMAADLLKAERESHFRELIRPERYILINPTIPEISEWVAHAERERALAVDVETKGGQITTIGFAYSASEAISIPFVDSRKPGHNAWSDPLEELFVRQLVNRLLTCPAIKIFQNGMYDLQYILKEGYGICNVKEDTMLQHHAMYPELQKSLGFLGSIYTNESSWKLLRKRGKEDSLKKEDS